MEIDYNEKNWEQKSCPKYDCRKDSCSKCKCGLQRVFIPTVLGDDSADSPVAPKNGEYCNAIVVYETNGHIYIYSKEGIPTLLASGGGGDYDEIIKEIQEDLAKTENDLAQEILDRGAADDILQEEINDLKNSPDVVDIVATYATLQAYDTSTLGDNDIIRVLADETHDGMSTYYRWSTTTQTWTFIGEVGDYYTKDQVDDLLDDKQNVLTAGANIVITNDTISATDTTYNDFVGTDGQDVGVAGLVPAPATSDTDKFLKSDGTWATAGGGGSSITPVQTTGTSTTDVMSQDATTKMIYPDITNNPTKISIGNSTINANTGVAINGTINTTRTNNIVISANPSSPAVVGPNGRSDNIVIGSDAHNDMGTGNISIGTSANSTGGAISPYNVAIGYYANVNSKNYSVALGGEARCTRDGEVNIGTGYNSHGFNSTNYRVIGGVHDGQLANDAVTVGQVNAVIDAINAALGSSISHIGA